MSLVRPLERFTSILEFLQEEQDLRRQRENWPAIQVEGDLPRRRCGDDEKDLARPRVCRLCSHVGQTPYCPACLAFTMEEASSEPPPG